MIISTNDENFEEKKREQMKKLDVEEIVKRNTPKKDIIEKPLVEETNMILEDPIVEVVEEIEEEPKKRQLSREEYCQAIERIVIEKYNA